MCVFTWTTEIQGRSKRRLVPHVHRERSGICWFRPANSVAGTSNLSVDSPALTGAGSNADGPSDWDAYEGIRIDNLVQRRDG